MDIHNTDQSVPSEKNDYHKVPEITISPHVHSKQLGEKDEKNEKQEFHSRPSNIMNIFKKGLIRNSTRRTSKGKLAFTENTQTKENTYKNFLGFGKSQEEDGLGKKTGMPLLNLDAAILAKMQKNHQIEKYEKDNDVQAERFIVEGGNMKRKSRVGAITMINLETLLDTTLAKMTPEERYDAAGRMFRDAVLSKNTRIYIPNPYIRFLYNWQTHPGWESFLVFISWVYLFLSFWENPYSGSQEYEPYSVQFHITTSIEIFVLGILFLYDLLGVILKYTDEDTKERVFPFKFSSRMFLNILLIIDFTLFYGCYTHHVSYFRFGRLIRPIKLPYYSKAMRRIIFSVIKCMHHILDIVLLFTITIALFALLALKLFEDAYDPDELTADNDMTGYVAASKQLYILTTFANYPTVMKPYMNYSPYYFFYFLPFIMIILVFFIPIPVAKLFDEYNKCSAQILRKDRLKEKDAYFKVHCCLDIDGKGTINPYQWRQLCSKVYHKKLEEDEDGVDVIKMQPVEGVKAPSKAPKSKVDQELLSKVNDIYHFYDKNGDGVLDIFEFFEACELMSMCEDVHNAYVYDPACWKHFRAFCNTKLKFHIWVESIWFEAFIFLLIIINIIVLIIEAASTDKKTQEDCQMADYVLLWFYVLEIILKIITLGVTDYFRDAWNKFDFTLVILSFIIASTISFMKMARYLKGTKMLRTAGKAKALKGVKGFRICTPIMSPFKRIKEMIVLVGINMPNIMNILNVLILWFYIFSIIGIEAFHPEKQRIKSTDYESSIVGDFSSFSMAMLVMCQVVTQGSWHSLIYHYSESFNSYLTFLYFSTLQFGAVIILLALVFGIVWSVYYSASKSERALLNSGIEDQSEDDEPSDSFDQDESEISQSDAIIDNKLEPTPEGLTPYGADSSSPEPHKFEEEGKTKSSANIQRGDTAKTDKLTKDRFFKKHIKDQLHHNFWQRQAILGDGNEENMRREEQQKLMKELDLGLAGERFNIGYSDKFLHLLNQQTINFMKNMRRGNSLQELQYNLFTILKKLNEKSRKGTLFCHLHEISVKNEGILTSELFHTDDDELRKRNEGILISELFAPNGDYLEGTTDVLNMNSMMKDIWAESEKSRQKQPFTMNNYFEFSESHWVSLLKGQNADKSRKEKLFELFGELGAKCGSSISKLGKHNYIWNCVVTPIAFNNEVANSIDEQQAVVRHHNFPNLSILRAPHVYPNEKPNIFKHNESMEMQSEDQVWFSNLYLVCFIPQKRGMKADTPDIVRSPDVSPMDTPTPDQRVNTLGDEAVQPEIIEFFEDIKEIIERYKCTLEGELDEKYKEIYRDLYKEIRGSKKRSRVVTMEPSFHAESLLLLKGLETKDAAPGE